MRFLSLIGLFLSALSLSSANTLHLGEQLPLRSESTDADTINFLSLGDWGSVNSDQAAVANQMGIAASDSNAAFLLALGDNFYEFGVLTDTDSAWKTTYTNVYDAPSLSIPWYVILGNHDHYSLTAGQAEIDYYKNRRDNRWTLPSNYYTQVFNLTTATGSFTAQIVMIDTVILSGLWHDKLWAFTPRNDALAQTQLQWIESTLAESTADWIFVAGHYPVFSGGEHGDTADLVNNLKPLLEKYNVDAYMSGHDHNLQHLQSGSVNYWLSGNGAKRGSYSAIQQSLFGVVDPGFMLHSLNSTHMHTEIIDLNGNHVYEYTQARVPKTQRYTATA